MRWSILLLMILLPAGPAARADENILDVLARSQRARLDRAHAVDKTSARAQVVRSSFETLIRVLGLRRSVELWVIAGEAVAETSQGHIVLANESLADLGEGERLFILAHELGHVELRHWEQTQRLYQKWIPGVVTPAHTEPVAALLGRDAAGLAYRQELEADAFALRALHALDHTSRDALAAIVHMGTSPDTATHPGTGKRLAALRAADAARSRNGQPETRNEATDSVSRAD